MAKKAARRGAKSEPDDIEYGKAVAEIETLLESIDRDEVDVDELSEKVERAVQLIRVCQQKLRSTEARVTEILSELGELEDPLPEVDPPGAPEPAGEVGEAGRDESDESDEVDDLPF